MNQEIKMIEVEKMIDSIADHFLQWLKLILEKDDYISHRVSNAFGVVNPVDDEILEQTWERESLEAQIREQLVNPILFGLLKLHGYDPHYAKEMRINHGHGYLARASNESFEEVNFCQILFRGTGIRPNAIKYTEVGLFDKQFRRHRCLLNKVYIIDWNETAHMKDHSIPTESSYHFAKRIKRVALIDLFEEYFTIDEYNLFIQKVKKTISEANAVLGFDTIHKLTPRYIHQIKATIKEDLLSWKLSFRKYHYTEYDNRARREVIADKDMSPLTVDQGSLNDLSIILDNCYQMGLYKAMFGTGEFAKSFVTAEYLYSLFDKGQYSIEFTAVACGYFKFLEQLIYKIVKLFLQSGEFENKTIKAVPKKYKKIQKVYREGLFELQNAGIIAKDRVPFKAEYEKAFDIMLNPLIYFLEQDMDFWTVSGKGKEFICSLLHNYADHCRNEHFHKDNIYEFADIEQIRDNTITLALLLLGALKIPRALACNELSIYDDIYDSLVETLIKKRPPRYLVFYLQFGEEMIMAHKYFGKRILKVDEYGNLGENEFVFARISDRDEPRQIQNEEEYERWFSMKEKIVISSKHYPESVWYERFSPQCKRVLMWSKELSTTYAC